MLDARAVFDQMKHHDVVSWTSLLLGYAETGESKMVLELFKAFECTGLEATLPTFAAVLMACGTLVDLETGRKIHAGICKRGLESSSVTNSVIDFYGKCGSIAVAQHIFDSAVISRDVVLWNTLIASYSHQGDAAKVVEIFGNVLEEGVRPDGFTFLSVIAACSAAGWIEQGRKFFQEMWRYGVAPGLRHYSSMVDLFGRASSLEEAVAVERAMPFKHDQVARTTLLAASLRD
ncbi:putative pentatricopeptide repeat-containing protein At1g68930 [Selaginella moellendorffii]|uniref:putative pentatricopeptide repeat-containing protein At1g68930 n=1 Tax=Selaginella moellendorffii TaxID=88036 RepID=UPI000D1C6BF8|nr:putative pentatricopeptide repeat-containing protein At1g68930 [Selaginella moellendorffii]|eukprot:XP_024538378.1 putative pentatricopeptide repeat-containing protein At1g68930 [Selaginella moellendorffii]